MRQGQLSRDTAGHSGSRRYLVERGDTGLGRDAYGLPRRQRSRHAYDPDAPYSPDDGYPASFSKYEDEETEAAGEPVEMADDDYGRLLRSPGGVSPPPPDYL